VELVKQVKLVTFFVISFIFY